MRPADLQDVYELTPMQQGMLFHTLLAPESGNYFEQLVCDLRGPLDVNAFARAWEWEIRRHPIFRTSFVTDGEEKPVQIVQRDVKLPFEQHDWRLLSPEERRKREERFLLADRERGFDLARAPLMRLVLFRLDENLHRFVWSRHHLLLDAWSRSLVFNELFCAYEAFRTGREFNTPSSRPYGDYIAWLQEQDLGKAERYWRNVFRDFPGPSPLEIGPAPRSPKNPNGIYEEQVLRISAPETSRLRAFARERSLTLNTLVQGVWALLLGCYGNRDDVVFGATVSGRPASLDGVESMVGLFINTLPVRVRLPPEVRVDTWLAALQDQQAELREHEYSALVDVQRWSGVPADRPLFDTLVVFESAPRAEARESREKSLRVTNARGLGSRTGYSLCLRADVQDELLLVAVSDARRYNAAAVVRMLGHFRNLLQSVVANPQSRLSTLELMSDSERHQVLVEWNQTEAEYPKDKTVHRLFEEQTQRMPGAEAVEFEGKRLTYGQLNERANRLARFLSKRGVGPEVLVGLSIERSLEMVVGLLGILKAGGAYLPLDPGYPRKRVAFMLEESAARVVLTQESLAESLPEGRFERVRLDADWAEIERESSENPASGATPRNLAYVMYTSGSTGTPKGVAIEHRNVVALLAWARECFSDREFGGVLASTSICFDPSVFELFAPLAWGGKVVLAQNALELPRLPAVGEVRLLNTVPSAMTELLRTGELPASVETVNMFGEPLATSLVREIFRHGTVRRVLDLYGPTEDTVYSTCAARSAEGPATIGRPISNKRVYILDSRLQPVPVGVPGDLYVAGSGIGRGYVSRPELTAEKFLPDPFRSGGERMYSTGDRARFLPGGDIQFLGRLDNQVKIRGYRVEMGEIEEALARHPEVRACAVAARQEASGDKRLVGYVVANERKHPTVTALRDFLKTTLPDHMVPSVFGFLDALPLTPNGKIDRRALPDPEPTRPDLEDILVAPRTPNEEVLAGIWSQVLGVAKIGVNDDFFALGGHSLIATQIISRARDAFHLEIPLRDLFSNPTVADLALIVAQRQAERVAPTQLERLLSELEAPTRETGPKWR